MSKSTIAMRRVPAPFYPCPSAESVVKKFMFLRFTATFAVTAVFASASFAVTATGLSSFEGIEEPTVIFRVNTGKLEPDPDNFVNIVELGDSAIRTTLRYQSDWWDGDRDTTNRDRGRAEVKGLGPHQKHGDTFEYTTTWRTSAPFHGSGRFCHLFQLKATDGDSGLPLVTMSIQGGTESATVEANPDGPKIIARSFAWKPATWQAVRLRIKTSPNPDGELTASIDGDSFRGATGVALSRSHSSGYRPKWGLYRSHRPEMTIGHDHVDHKQMAAIHLSSASGTTPVAIDNAALELAARKRTALTSAADALAWLEAQPASAGRDFALGSLAAKWAETDSPAAIAWAERLPAGTLRNDAVMRIFNRWADQDVGAAMQWLLAHAPHRELDALVWFFATDTTYRYINRPLALQSLPLIADSELRSHAIEHVIEIWSRRESGNARRYVTESELLTPEQKKRILARIRNRSRND